MKKDVPIIMYMTTNQVVSIKSIIHLLTFVKINTPTSERSHIKPGIIDTKITERKTLKTLRNMSKNLSTIYVKLKAYNDVAPNPPPITGKQNKTQPLKNKLFNLLRTLRTKFSTKTESQKPENTEPENAVGLRRWLGAF